MNEIFLNKNEVHDTAQYNFAGLKSTKSKKIDIVMYKRNIFDLLSLEPDIIICRFPNETIEQFAERAVRMEQAINKEFKNEC